MSNWLYPPGLRLPPSGYKFDYGSDCILCIYFRFAFLFVGYYLAEADNAVYGLFNVVLFN